MTSLKEICELYKLLQELCNPDSINMKNFIGHFKSNKNSLMKKYKQFNPVNNQEDEDSSAHPLYPDTGYIYNKAKKKKKPNAEIKIIETVSEIRNQRAKGGKKPFTNFQAL
jgi:hypothetical protein